MPLHFQAKCHTKLNHAIYFCGTYNLKLWSPHIRTTCVPHLGKQTHIDTFCGTYNLKLWPPHIETTCVPKQENRHTLLLFVAHLTSNCDRHTQRQHVCHTQKNRVYMWPHIQYWYYMSVTICGHIQYHFRLIIYLNDILDSFCIMLSTDYIFQMLYTGKHIPCFIIRIKLPDICCSYFKECKM